MAKRTPSSPQAALNPRFARQHGCAWFDMEPGSDLNKAGIWVSQGGETFRRIHGAGALDPQVIWWTNLSLSKTWMVGRLEQVKDTAFLGPDWADLLAEQGQRPDGSVVELWSETFARLAEWSSELSRVVQPDQPWSWGNGRLMDVWADRWKWGVPMDQAPRPQPVLAAAYVPDVEHVPMGGSPQWAGRRRIVLSLPRPRHAQRIWTARAPAGNWSLIEEGLWPRLPEERLRWLKTQRQPALVRVDRVEWAHGQEEMGRTWMGLRGRPFPAAIPDPIWMTSDEALDLSQMARFDIESAYIGERWDYGSAPDWWQGEINDSPLGQHSLMLGLVSHTAWQAGASPTRDPVRRALMATTATAVWRRAADRRLCFEAARRLVAHGIPVMNHGEGRVVVAVDPAMPMHELATQVKAAGFVLPRPLAQELALEADADPADPIEVAHWLGRVGEPHSLWDLDRVIAPWLGPGPEVTQLLNDAARRLARLDSTATPAMGTWWRQALPDQLKRAAERLRAAAKRRGRAAA